MQLKFSLLCFLVMGMAAKGNLFGQQFTPANNEDEFERQYQERIKKDVLNGVYIPKNLDDAFAQLNKLISPESQATIKSIPEDSVCIVLHRRLGQWMIMNWGFYDGSRLSHYLRSAGITYPDDMADFLLIGYHRHLNGKPVNVRDLAIFYKEKRKKEFEERQQSMPVLHEETRKRPKD